MCLWSSVLLKSGSPLALHSTPLLNGCINGYNILQGKAKGIKTLGFFCLFFSLRESIKVCDEKVLYSSNGTCIHLRNISPLVLSSNLWEGP